MSQEWSNASFCALILMGVSGSGKSTIGDRLAMRLHWSFEDGDQFHPDSNVEKMRAGHPLTDDDRWPWLKAIAAKIDRKRVRAEPVIIACSALKRAYRDVLVGGHKDVRIVYLRGDSALIAKRITHRKGHFMPAELLESQFNTLEEPSSDENPIVIEIDASIDQIVDRIVDYLDRQYGIWA